jgi:hypothetical protein
MRRIWLSVAVALLVGSFAGRASALPFEPGEHLKLKVSYLRMNIGDVDLIVTEQLDEGLRLWPLQMHARTYGFFNSIHSVDDWLVSRFDPVTKRTYGSEYNQKEKDGRTVETVRLEKESAHIRRMTPRGQRERIDKALPGAYDILAAIYVLRTLDYQNGEVRLPIFNAGKSWEMSAHVEGRESVKTDAGRFDTIVVSCMTYFGGEFHNGREMKVWLTNDERRMPVKIEADYLVGTLRAQLVSHSGTLMAQK